MSGAPVLDISTVTPAMCQDAGINFHRLQQQLGDASTVPFTQEDRDRLGELRNKLLKRIKVVIVPSFVMSGVSMIVGIVMVSISTDRLGELRNKLLKWIKVTIVPSFVMSGVSMIVGIIMVSISTGLLYAFNAGIIAGVKGFVLAVMSVCMIREGKKTPTGDKTTRRMQSLVIIHTVLGCTMMCIAGASWGFSGLLGTAECLKRIGGNYVVRKYDILNCPSDSLLAVSILTMIIVPVLMILFFVTCCAYSCSNARAFGRKSGYEVLLELQMSNNARMIAVQQHEQQLFQEQLLQQQQQQHGGGHVMPHQQPMNPGLLATPGYNPASQYPASQGVQDSYPQPGTLPPHTPGLSPHPSPHMPSCAGTNGDAPPSYHDVMKTENMAEFGVTDAGPAQKE